MHMQSKLVLCIGKQVAQVMITCNCESVFPNDATDQCWSKLDCSSSHLTENEAIQVIMNIATLNVYYLMSFVNFFSHNFMNRCCKLMSIIGTYMLTHIIQPYSHNPFMVTVIPTNNVEGNTC